MIDRADPVRDAEGPILTGVPRSARLVYLDNLRVFAMLLGVLVHTTTLSDFGRIEVVNTLSWSFRMATFFVVSGFFSALIAEKIGYPAFLKQRLVTLGVPLLFGLLVLNPMTLWLIALHHNPGAASNLNLAEVLRAAMEGQRALEGPVIWHLHLWFLFSLLVYMISIPALFAAAKNEIISETVNNIMRSVPHVLLPLLIALTVSFGVVLARTLTVVVIRPLTDTWLAQVTMDYLPFFALGFFFQLRKAEWDAIHKVDPLIFLLAGSLFTLDRMFGIFELHGQAGEALRLFSVALLRCAMIFLLLYIFKRFMDRANNLSRFLSRSIYTVYICHFFLIYAISHVFNLSGNSLTTFFFVAGLSYLVSFLVHGQLVERFPSLALIMNGRHAKPFGKEIRSTIKDGRG